MYKFLALLFVIVIIGQAMASPTSDERELLRKKRLLGLLGGGGGGQGGGGQGGGLLDLQSLLGGLGQTVNGLTQGLGLGGILGRRKRYATADFDSMDLADEEQ